MWCTSCGQQAGDAATPDLAAQLAAHDCPADPNLDTGDSVDSLAELEALLQPPDPRALVELNYPHAAALVGELAAARQVIQAARLVGHLDLDDTDVAERLADALDAYDQHRQQQREEG